MGRLFTQAQVDRALLKEQLILRVEQGESLAVVSKELGLACHPKHFSRLRRRYAAGGRHWTALVDEREGRVSAKLTAELVQWTMAALQRDPAITATQLRIEIEREFKVEVSERHLRRLAHVLGRSGRKGRPSRLGTPGGLPTKPLLIEQTPHAGIFFPAGRFVAHADCAYAPPYSGRVQAPLSTALSGGRTPALEQSGRDGDE